MPVFIALYSLFETGGIERRVRFPCALPIFNKTNSIQAFVMVFEFQMLTNAKA
jgi:hypothetical protein